MHKPRLAALAVALGALAPALAGAQSMGSGVPAYEPPPPAAPPARSSEVLKKAAPADKSAFGSQESVVADFASAYASHGKPKLALFWNRQLSEALSDWYSDTRVVNRSESSSSMSGEFNLDKKGGQQNVVEVQRRNQNDRRAQMTESFEWEFQDGFLEPFLEAGATVLDRAAIMRLTGAEMGSDSATQVEMAALQGKADFLMEILVSPNGNSRTGYELRSRILEVKTGRIVAMVNSKSLKEWNPDHKIMVGPQGFVEMDDDDETFGPDGDQKIVADAQGLRVKKKPPKLSKISRNLAYNTMNGLMKQWR